MIETEVFQRMNKKGSSRKLTFWHRGKVIYSEEFSNIDGLKELKDELAREMAWLDDYLKGLK